jgi:hypothetical protein
MDGMVAHRFLDGIPGNRRPLGCRQPRQERCCLLLVLLLTLTVTRDRRRRHGARRKARRADSTTRSSHWTATPKGIIGLLLSTFDGAESRLERSIDFLIVDRLEAEVFCRAIRSASPKPAATCSKVVIGWSACLDLTVVETGFCWTSIKKRKEKRKTRGKK